jgi:hypothetical protein
MKLIPSMEKVSKHLRLKSPGSDGATQMGQDHGGSIAKNIGGQ